MVELEPQRLDAVFHALSDPTRRAMLRALAGEDHNVSTLAAPFAMSLAAASKHIQTLERAGLVKREVQGRTHVVRLDAEALAGADEWISFYRKFWNERLGDLEAALKRDKSKKKEPKS